MPSTLSSPYAGRPAGWVRTGGATGVRARSYGPGRPHVSTPADATTRLHAPRRVRSRALRGRRPGVSGVAPRPSALRGRSVHPEAHPPGEVPARLPYVVERGARRTWSNGERGVRGRCPGGYSVGWRLIGP